MAAQQLTLINPRPLDWRLDQRTIDRGKAGVKAAREALRAGVARAEQRRVTEHAAHPTAA